MATPRILYNNSTGTTSTSLSSSATTMSMSSAPTWATVVSPNYIPVTLDTGTNMEIVHVTGYTSGQSNATIVRGQEGTSAVSHLSGITWAVDPTVGDIPVSPYLYMPAPTGVASTDTAAFNNIITLLGGASSGSGIVGLQAGTYSFNNTIDQITSPLIGIVGPGSAICTISKADSGDTLSLFYPNFITDFNTGTIKSGAPIKGFTIDGTNTTGPANGIHMGDRSWQHIDDVVVQNFNNYMTNGTATFTTSSSTITFASYTSSMQGYPVLGAGIPFPAYARGTSSGSFTLSSSATSTVAINPTASGGVIQVGVSHGVLFQNQVGWMERCFVNMQVNLCDVGWGFCSTSSAFSYGYSEWTITCSNNPNQHMVVFHNGASGPQFAGGAFKLWGNATNQSTTVYGTIIWVNSAAFELWNNNWILSVEMNASYDSGTAQTGNQMFRGTSGMIFQAWGQLTYQVYAYGSGYPLFTNTNLSSTGAGFYFAGIINGGSNDTYLPSTGSSGWTSVGTPRGV